MTLRGPDYRNPEAAIINMTQEEYNQLKEHKGAIQLTLQLLEIEARIQDKSNSRVTVVIKPAPKDFFGRVFVNILTGRARFVTMRSEEFAQDLEDNGFEVEFL